MRHASSEMRRQQLISKEAEAEGRYNHRLRFLVQLGASELHGVARSQNRVGRARRDERSKPKPEEQINEIRGRRTRRRKSVFTSHLHVRLLNRLNAQSSWRHTLISFCFLTFKVMFSN